jgi:hypothetical protein
MVTCQNVSCKKIFLAPLKAINLQGNPTEPYFACPFCLTKIEIKQNAIAPIDVEETLLEEPKSKTKPKAKMEDKEIRPISQEKPGDCKYHPGYLSERSSKEQIPDDCLVCKRIVDCMLKKNAN